jgi:hypothetical protein
LASEKEASEPLSWPIFCSNITIYRELRSSDSDMMEILSHNNPALGTQATVVPAEAQRRICRMLAGQVVLLAHRVEYLLNNPLDSEHDQTVALNGAVVDFKDWLSVLRDRSEPPIPPISSLRRFEGVVRCTPEIRDAILHERAFPTKGAPAFFERLYGNISFAEWEDAAWFRQGWADSIQRLRATMDDGIEHPEHPLRIGEYQLNDLDISVRQELSSLCRRRFIGALSNEPRKGLEFELSPDDLKSMFGETSSVVWTLHHEHKLSGFFHAYLDMSPLSFGGRVNVAHWSRTNAIPLGQCAYGELVVTDPALSRALGPRGIDPYLEVLETARQSLSLMGITHLLGEVRINPSFNLSM